MCLDAFMTGDLRDDSDAPDIDVLAGTGGQVQVWTSVGETNQYWYPTH
jgi:hypothetical protein